MMNKTIAIFGGTQELTYKKIGKNYDLKVLFHNGKYRNGGNKKEFRNIIKKADCVVMMIGALGHVSMDIVKELCKEYDKEMIFHKGRGASGAIQACLPYVKTLAAV